MGSMGIRMVPRAAFLRAREPRHPDSGEGLREMEDLQAGLLRLKRRRGRLLRQLGERALAVLAEGGALDSKEPRAQGLLREIQRLERELHQMEERLRAKSPSPNVAGSSLPRAPGTDSRFPFSR